MKISKIFGCFPQTNDNEVTQTFYLWVSHNFCSRATNLELKDVPFHLTLAWACASPSLPGGYGNLTPHASLNNNQWHFHPEMVSAKLMNNGPEKVHCSGSQSQLRNLL